MYEGRFPFACLKSELTYDNNVATIVFHAYVHHTFTVVEDPQVYYFGCEPGDVFVVVGVFDPNQHQQPAIDL